MADFPPPLTSSILELLKSDVPQTKSQTMRHDLMNLVNTTLFEKYEDPQLKVSIYGPVVNSQVYIYIPCLGP